MRSARRHARAVNWVFTIFLCLLCADVFAAPDAPHNAATGTGCFSCHDVTSLNPVLLPDHPRKDLGGPVDMDDTLFNNTCWGCHVDASPPLYVETHSSLQTNGSASWTVECRVCHNPHYQEQNNLYSTTFGKFIRTKVNLDRIQLYDTDGNPVTDPARTGFKPVRLTAAQGPNSFADGDATYNGICEICHTSTGHWTRTAVEAGNKHFARLNCMECHPHDQGMKPVPPDHAALVTVPSFCVGCHPDTVFDLHNSSVNGWVNCDRCHDKDDNYALNGLLPFYLGGKLTWNAAKEKDVFASGHGRCDACHQGQFHEHVTDTGHGRLHNNIILGYDTDHNGTGDQVLACDACHYPDAIQEHVTRRGYSCSVCHNRSEIGLDEVTAIADSVTAGMAGTKVFCDDCHNDDHFLTDAGTSLVKEHHYTVYSRTGSCTKCHVVGPGKSGPKRPPCFVCHGAGKPRDPQRAGTDKHDQGPAFTGDTVDDFRACFSCHLNGGPGHVSGITPPVHGMLGPLPTGTVLWPWGYYKDASNAWVEPPLLIPSNAVPDIPMPPNLENDPDKWPGWPGFGTIRLKAREYRGGQKYRYPETEPPKAWATERDTDADGQDFQGLQYQTNQYDFYMRDYATVQITYNGDTKFVPSYDSSGDGGQPSGSGSLRVDISDAAAITAGARWRVDGGSWQTSGATVSGLAARGKHQVEFKPLADWDEPEPLEVTITDLQTTTLSGPAATYSTCSSDIRLSLARDAGGTTFDWTSPEQVETFPVTSGQDGPVECVLWRDSGGTLVEPDGFRVQTTEDGKGCKLDKDGITPAGQYDLLLQVNGSSCFRNNAELPLTVTVTATGEPSPVGQNGGKISGPLGSISLTNTKGQSLMHLTGNLYVRLDSLGTLSTVAINKINENNYTLEERDTFTAKPGGIIKVTESIVAVIYTEKPGATYDNYLKTYRIQPDGTIIGELHTFFIESGSMSVGPKIHPHGLNDSIFIISWRNNNGQMLLTVNIDPASGTVSEIDRVAGFASSNNFNDIVHVSGEYYVMQLRSNLRIIRIGADGAILDTAVSVTEIAIGETNVWGWQGEIIRVHDNIFAIAHSNGYWQGYLDTFRVNTEGTVTLKFINRYMFEPCGTGDGTKPSITKVSDNIFAVTYYKRTACDAVGTSVTMHTYQISDEGRLKVPALDKLELQGASQSGFPVLVQVSDDIFAYALHNYNTLGNEDVFYGIRIYRISTDGDLDGIAYVDDNCPGSANAGQLDSDGDGVGDPCDACPGFDDTADGDNDLIPDGCDTCAGHDDTVDSDSDGVADGCDPCPNDPDDDADNDGICAGSGYNSPKLGDNDNCPSTANTNQIDSDCDGVGDSCDGPAVYFPPGSATVTGRTANSVTVSWNDLMNGEDGYRIEGKQGACGDNTYSLGPLATVYRHDRFNTGIDTDSWVPGAAVQTTSTNTLPASVSDASGTAEVSWENGQVRLHNVMNDVGGAGAFNNANISVKKFAEIVGDRDFDVQVDYALPNGAFFGDSYHVDVRLVFYFPQTGGNNNSFYVERRAANYFAALEVNGVLEYNTIPTTDLTGTLRLVRKNRELAAYVLKGNEWVLVKKHRQPLTADLVPTWMGIVQYAQRNESDGGELTALVDNFRFNIVASVPVPVLDIPLEDSSWQDVSTGNNHGSPHNGVEIVADPERILAGSFDGIDDYIEVSGSGNLGNVTDTSFTFAAWAKPESVPPHLDAGPSDDPPGPANDWAYAIFGRPGWHLDLHYNPARQFVFEIWNDTPSWFGVVSAAYDPGQWHHVVGVVDDSGKTFSLYVDGLLAGSKPFTGKLRDYGTLPYYIGTSNHDAAAYNWFFDGLIDDVRIFDRALSADDVSALYNNRLEINATGLSPDTAYCARVYPFKTNECANWLNHSVQAEGATLTTAATEATTAGKASAVSLWGATSLHVNMPYLNDSDGDNSYTVEYKLSSDAVWTTHVAGAAHSASPYATTISGLSLFARYDVRVTYDDPDGVNGVAQQVIANVMIVGPDTSCLAILTNGGSVGDGMYWIDPDGAGPNEPYQAYCDMHSDGGGWALAMKMDGSQDTFQYASGYWTNVNTLNPTSLSFDTTQAKLQPFNDVAFTQVRLGMRHYTNPADDIDWITINQAANSLVDVFNSGYIATTVGRAGWLNLLEGVNTQPNCNKEGFNAEQTYSKMRIGLAMNQENDCNSCDRILGFGNQIGTHPWGNWAVVGGGYPGTNTVAYGWIMVR